MTNNTDNTICLLKLFTSKRNDIVEVRTNLTLCFVYRRGMSHTVVCLLKEEKVERLWETLIKYPYDGFLVVDNYSV